MKDFSQKKMEDFLKDLEREILETEALLQQAKKGGGTQVEDTLGLAGGALTTGTSPESPTGEDTEAQDRVRKRMKKVFSSPDDVSDKQLKTLFAEAKKVDKTTKGSEFADMAESLKKEKAYRSESEKIKASATEGLKSSEAAMARMTSLLEQLTDDNPETPAEAAAMLKELDQLMDSLKTQKEEVLRVRGLRPTGRA